ncbi:MAG TPA: hemerythrin domain-containing protein [Methanocella sp.]|nr:hemerythrin domain-containing protein [Methanocella sp.]
MAQKMMQRMPPGLEEGVEKMSATEELSFEHAMLDRILLAMDKTLMAGTSPKADLSPIDQACDMIKQVVDQHHMKIEEEEIYPKFADTGLSDFVATLESQHDDMRRLVARMADLSKTGAVRDRSEMDELKRDFDNFHKMVMAHAAWEESVLFPAMLGTWSEDELNDLRETQEEHEKKLLGKDAVKKVTGMLLDLESAAGITDVSDFTRKVK